MSYITNLIKIRKEKGYTQAQIANVLNTSTQYYQKYEKGKHPLPIEHFLKLCNFYGISADELLREEDTRYYKEVTMDENQKALKAAEFIEKLEFSSYAEFLAITTKSNDYLWLKEYLGELPLYLLVCEKAGINPVAIDKFDIEE